MRYYTSAPTLQRVLYYCLRTSKLDLHQTGSLHCKFFSFDFPFFYSVRKEDNLQTGEGGVGEVPKYTKVRSLVKPEFI